MGGSVTGGFLRGKRTLAQIFEQVFGRLLGLRYAGLNTLGAGSIPLGVCAGRYLFPRSRTKR